MNKIFINYKKISKPARASMWFIASNVLLKGISFFTLPIFSRLLTTSEYGTVSVYTSWVATISIVTTLTIWGGGFNVGMVKYENNYRKMISSFQGLATFTTLVFFMLSLFFLDEISKWFGISKLLIVCMYLEILSQIPFNIWSIEHRYNFEYKKLIFITIFIALSSPIIGVLAVKNTTFKAEAKIISNLVILLIIGAVLFVHNQSKGKVFYNKEYWKFGLKFNLALIPHYLSTQILNQSDRIMINSMCGSGDAGIYSVAYNFALLLSLVTNGINSSLTPHIYQSLKEKSTEHLKGETTLIVLLVAIISLGLICIVPDVFMFMLPKEYYPALKIIPPVTLGAFFLFLYPLFGSIEFYFEENKYVTYASVIGAILNVVLNFTFIRLFGFIAAAYTTMFCYLCFTVCHYLFMIKVLKKNSMNNNIYNIKGIALISLVLVMMSFVMLYLYDYLWIRWGVLLLIILLLLISKKKLKKLVKEVRGK